MFHLRRIYFFWFLTSITFCLSLPTKGLDGEVRQSTPVQSFAGAYLAGRIAHANNDVAVAIDYFQQALTFSPENVQVKQDLLLLLLVNNQFTEALPLAERLKNEPEIERYSRLMLVADAFNRQNFAEIAPLLVLDEPDLMDELVATILEAWSLFGQGHEAQTIEQMETLEGPIWYDLFRYYNLALMYQLSGDAVQAEAAFSQAVEDHAGGASAPDAYERILLAYAAFKQASGDTQGAIEILDMGAKTLVGRHVFSILRQAVTEGQFLPPIVGDARAGAAELLYSVGTAFNRPGGEFYARLYLNIAYALRPDHDATLFQLAEIAVKSGQSQAALLLYQQIDAVSPYFRDGQWRLALTLADQERGSQAIELLNSLRTDWPDDENLLLALSSIYTRNKDYQQIVALIDAPTGGGHEDGEKSSGARESAQLSGARESAQWRLFFQRGIAYERLQQWSQAEADFRAALALSPDQPQVLNYLGYSLIDRDMKLEEALEMVQRAAELRPKDGAIIDSLGWAYYKLGRIEAAIERLEEAVKLQPEDPTINDHLGDAYWQVGRKFEAIFQWNHALAGEPEAEDKAKIEAKLKTGLVLDEPEQPSMTLVP